MMSVKKSAAIWATVAGITLLLIVILALQLKNLRKVGEIETRGRPLHDSLTYNEAIAIYGPAGNNYRFQFADCRGTPPVLQIKQGVKFMIDNRDEDAHTFKVGAQTLRIGAYDFVILTASTLGQQNVTCDDGPNAVLNVQK